MNWIKILLLLLPLLIAGRDRYAIQIKHRKKSVHLKRLFTLSDQQLDEMRKKGEQLSNIKLPDLTNYYIIESDVPVKGGHLIPIPTPPPGGVDLIPITPDFTNHQGYLQSYETHYGLNSRYGWEFEGGDGSGITIVDIEYDWQLDHEDLNLKEDGILYDSEGKNLTGTPAIKIACVDPRINSPELCKSDQHGVAVLGILAAENNNYGISGMTIKSDVKVVSSCTKEYPEDEQGEWRFSNADAILRAASGLQVGDILLLEAQTAWYGPIEYSYHEFAAIRYATALGIIVIEAAGNGGLNLDIESGTGSTFYRDQTSRKRWIYNEYNAGNTCCYEKDHDWNCIKYGSCDSGAIIVGAGSGPFWEWDSPNTRMSFSTYGSRVDVQAWGSSEVETLGYGDRFDGVTIEGEEKDPKQYYTAQFSGTSSASPMIAAVAAQLQGRHKVVYGTVLSPIELRSVLKLPQHSNPQMGDLTKQIGPQPDIKKLFDCCFQPCGESHCRYYQSCSEGSCTTAEGFCDGETECGEGEICYLHQCVDLCSGITCGEHMSCHAEGSSGVCRCDEGYQLKGEICEPVVVSQPTAAPHPSCGYGTGAGFLWLLLLPSLLLLRRSRQQRARR